MRSHRTHKHHTTFRPFPQELKHQIALTNLRDEARVAAEAAEDRAREVAAATRRAERAEEDRAAADAAARTEIDRLEEALAAARAASAARAAEAAASPSGEALTQLLAEARQEWEAAAAERLAAVEAEVLRGANERAAEAAKEAAKAAEAEKQRALKLEASKWKQALKEAEKRVALEVQQGHMDGRLEREAELRNEMAFAAEQHRLAALAAEERAKRAAVDAEAAFAQVRTAPVVCMHGATGHGVVFSLLLGAALTSSTVPATAACAGAARGVRGGAAGRGGGGRACGQGALPGGVAGLAGGPGGRGRRRCARRGTPINTPAPCTPLRRL